MDKNIKKVVDELYDCLSQQLNLINQLRRQFEAEDITSMCERDAIEQENNSLTTTIPNGSTEVKTKTVKHELVATRYATRSYLIATRSNPSEKLQAFKNPSEDSTDKYFILNIYSDNTFSFELCSLNAIALQTIRDNKLLSSGVATLDGEIAKGCRLKVNAPGVGRVEGNFYIIEKPMDVSVINNAE